MGCLLALFALVGCYDDPHPATSASAATPQEAGGEKGGSATVPELAAVPAAQAAHAAEKDSWAPANTVPEGYRGVVATPDPKDSIYAVASDAAILEPGTAFPALQANQVVRLVPCGNQMVRDEIFFRSKDGVPFFAVVVGNMKIGCGSPDDVREWAALPGILDDSGRWSVRVSTVYAESIFKSENYAVVLSVVEYGRSRTARAHFASGRPFSPSIEAAFGVSTDMDRLRLDSARVRQITVPIN